MVNNTKVAEEPAVSIHIGPDRSLEEMSSGFLWNSLVSDSGTLTGALTPQNEGWPAIGDPADPAPPKLLDFLIDMFIIAKSPVAPDGSHRFPRPPNKS